MKRCLLLLLVFVLPLQLSWAAIHYCEDDDGVGLLNVASAQFDDHRHAPVPEAGSGSTASVSFDVQTGNADPCCAAAHACHGLHHLIANSPSDLAAPASERVRWLSSADPRPDSRTARLERPKWLAA
ncbi:hypothetical protein ACO2Q9_18825 [Variovorax sp. VNK109]|jgi:hypothetical protein|uniref:hypothetical protein n=1 Tax=Variovorax sp. VNK109 TaxID=3400919 RepID=UPI003BFFE1FC